jgi:predicted ArsR family transcriptional regulator
MNTRLQKTQNQQLENFLKKQPEISEDQQKVLEALKEIGPATAEQVANHLNVPINTISGRFGGEGELQDKNLIQVKGKVKNTRGYKCKLWEVVQ